MARFAKTLGLALILLAVLLGIGWYLVTRTSLVTGPALNALNEELEKKTTLDVSVGRFSGDWLRSLNLHDVVVTAVTDETTDTLVTIGEIALEYDLGDVLASPRYVRRITITDPRILIPEGSPADWRDRIIRDIQTQTEESQTDFEFLVDEVRLVNGTVLRPATGNLYADSIDLQLSARRMEGRLDLNLQRAHIRTTAIGTVQSRGHVDYSNGLWRFDSLRVETPRSLIYLSGTKTLWQVLANPLDLRDIDAFVPLGIKGVLSYEGSVRPPDDQGGWRFAGTADGSLDRFSLSDLTVDLDIVPGFLQMHAVRGQLEGATLSGSASLRYDVRPFEWSYEGTMRHFDLIRFAPGSLASDLSGRVKLTSLGARSETLAITAEVELSAGQIDHKDFDSAHGALFITTDSLVLDERFHLYTHNTTLVGSGQIDYDGSLDLLASAYCSDLREWDEHVFADSVAGRADGFLYLSGDTKDPDLSGVANSDSLRLWDLTTRDFHARFFIPRFLTERSGTVEAHWGASSTWGVQTDSIDLQASLSGERVDISWAKWSSPVVQAEGSGWLDWSADTIPLHLYPLRVLWEGQTYAATDSTRITIDSLGFNFDTLAFQGPLGILNAHGRINYDNSMALNLDIENFRVAPVWRRFFPQVPIDGMVAAFGTVFGTFDIPELQLVGAVAEISYDERPLGDLDFDLRYEHQLLSVNRAHLENSDFYADLSGVFPVDLSFRPVEQRLLDRPLDGNLAATGAVLDRIAAFQPDLLESIQGPFAITARVTGTPHTPLLQGSAHLRSGTIKVLEIENPIEDLTVDLALRQDTILIERAEGLVRNGRKAGTITAGGSLLIESYNRFFYDITLTGRQVPARFEFEDYEVHTDMDLRVYGATPPLVYGTLKPIRIEDREPFSDEPDNRIEDTTVWDWDFTIEVPGNYWIRNDQAEVEIATDNLRLLRENGLVNLQGTARIVRGKVYLWDKVGRITRGELYFDNPANPDPRLDIDVSFRIQQTRLADAGPGSSSDVIDLKLHVSGRASEPLIQPEPPYTEETALLLLTTNTTVGGNTDPFGDRLRSGATGLLFSGLQRMMARKLGVETLDIESGEDASDTRITVGMYTTPHLYLYGRSPLSTSGGQELGFEYRFSRHLFLEGNRNKDNLYRLNLHFNWDY